MTIDVTRLAAQSECASQSCDLFEAGFSQASIPKLTVGDDHATVGIEWTVEASNVQAVRIYANSQLIHCQFVGGTCAAPTEFLVPGSYTWTWNTRGLLAAEYCIRFDTVRRVSGVPTVFCAYEVANALCPPASLVLSPPPTQPGLDFPDDEFFPTQWSLHNLRTQASTLYDADLDLPQAWTIETGNSDIVVAVCDEGVDWQHREMDEVVLPGFDLADLTNVLVSGCGGDPCDNPMSCLGLIASRADINGFDPFHCLRAGSNCSIPKYPDFTWNPPTISSWESSHGTQTDTDSYHGMRVISIIAGRRNNQWGIAGIAGGSGAALYDGVRIIPLALREFNTTGHPGVGVRISNGDAVAWCGSLPPDVDPIITPSGSFGQVLEASIAACATSLEYLTYLRERLDVNIRVVTFEVYADCQIGECTSTLGRFDAAVTAAWNAGIFIVSSAGNNYCEPGGDSTVISVASRPFVCAVADLNMMNQLSPISSCGATSTGDPCDFAKSTSPSDITICAPGSQIVNAVSPTFADPGFTSGAPATSEFVDSYSAFACGTSYSAPHVAGVAALLFSYAARPGAVVAANYQALTDTVANEADGVAIWQILCRSADPLGPVEHFGSGRVNAYRALLELRGQPNLPGDLNDDGLVNSADTAVLSAWLAGNGAGSTPQCLMDVDADGDIDSVDLKALKSYVNQGFPDLLVRANCF